MAEGGYYRCDGRDMLAQRCVQRLEFKWDGWFNAEKNSCVSHRLPIYHSRICGRVPGRLVRRVSI
jgi:hypothetical protein